MATGHLTSWHGHLEMEWQEVWSCPTAAPPNRDASWSQPRLVLLVLEPRRTLTFRDEPKEQLMLEPGTLGFAYWHNMYESEHGLSSRLLTVAHGARRRGSPPAAAIRISQALPGSGTGVVIGVLGDVSIAHWYMTIPPMDAG